MKQWTRLKALTVSCIGHTEIPGAFLKRLASDLPSLQKLTVKSPLPLNSAGDIVAVSSLKRLPRLVLQGEAAAALDDRKREALRCALRHVRFRTISLS
eukprot:tig00020564_g11445.t1